MKEKDIKDLNKYLMVNQDKWLLDFLAEYCCFNCIRYFTLRFLKIEVFQIEKTQKEKKKRRGETDYMLTTRKKILTLEK